MNEDYSNDKIVPLTEDEKRVIRKSLKLTGIIVVLAIILNIIVIAIFLSDLPTVFYFIMAAGIILTFFFMVLTQRKSYLDLKAGKKIISICSIDGKESTTDETPFYYLMIAGNRYRIRKELWDQVDAGQRVKISMLYHSQKIIDLKLL